MLRLPLSRVQESQVLQGRVTGVARKGGVKLVRNVVDSVQEIAYYVFSHIMFLVIEQIAEVRRVWFRVKTDAGRNARGHDVATCHRLSAPHLFVSLFQAGPVGKSRQK